MYRQDTKSDGRGSRIRSLGETKAEKGQVTRTSVPLGVSHPVRCDLDITLKIAVTEKAAGS